MLIEGFQKFLSMGKQSINIFLKLFVLAVLEPI